jgi:CubicO group peptidase (beta-lactamase class C family)
VTRDADRSLAPGFEARLDATLARALDNEVLNIPGFVAMARRGTSVYGPKAFGFADLASRRPMRADAMMRMYSMTKVLTSTIALMFYEKGLFKLNDPVARFIPSFDREWRVVRAAGAGERPEAEIAVRNMQTGTTSTVPYVGVPATNVMRVKHLMSETSGIGYESWGDTDEVEDHALGTRRGFQIANALRQRIHPTLYKSSNILGQDLTLAEFCDAIAEAGALATEPGRFSYGLGAAVLGRVIEVIHERHMGRAKRLSAIFEDMLFRPLGMTEAAFFLADFDARAERIPTLYGARVGDGTRDAIVRAEDAVPPTDPPYSNGTDHAAGPRKQESGDTGTLMPVADYAKFVDFLARGGVSEQGERLLSPVGVDTMTRRWVTGLDLDTALARHANCAGPFNATYPASFQFGWAIARADEEVAEFDAAEHAGACFWGGYAHTSVTYFRDEDAWIITAPQVMAHGSSGSRRIDQVLTTPALRTFLELWR